MKNTSLSLFRQVLNLIPKDDFNKIVEKGATASKRTMLFFLRAFTFTNHIKGANFGK